MRTLARIMKCIVTLRVTKIPAMTIPAVGDVADRRKILRFLAFFFPPSSAAMNRSVTQAQLLSLMFDSDSDMSWDTNSSDDSSDEGEEQMIVDALLLDNHQRTPVPNVYISFDTLHLDYDAPTCYRLFRFDRADSISKVDLYKGGQK